MYISKILKVIYSPRKTLKEIIQEPKYIGPLLILILLVAVNIASAYVVFSKEYYQQILPNTGVDTWTETTSYWTSPNANVSQSNDSITGTYYGTASIAFSNQNSSQVWMRLSDVGSINCSADGGYNLLSFRIKWTSPQETPIDLTMKMYSVNSSSDYFYDNLTATFSNSTYNTWNNFTSAGAIALAGTEWAMVGQPDWSNITGLQLEFTWAHNSSITLLIDGLFFLGPYAPFLQTAGGAYPLSYGVPGAIQYIVTWVLLTGMIYVVLKGFKTKIAWKPMLIAVGFLLITMFIGILITGLAYSTLPILHYPFDVYGGVAGEGKTAFNGIADQAAFATNVSLIGQILVWAWTTVLAAIAVHVATESSWPKSGGVAIIAYSVTILLVIVLIG